MIFLCQRTRRLSCSDNPSPMKSKYRRFSSGIHENGKKEDVPLRTAYSQDKPTVGSNNSQDNKAVFAREARLTKTRTETFELVK
ncbi:hypothetical protein TNCV_3927191 [Trichonephila clavipes]|nr:hypothetical protein TNCV_3927191 [Trichonephila clavipes]